MRTPHALLSSSIVALALTGFTTSADASLVLSAGAGNLEAQVEFDVSGSDLIVTLSNISAFDVMVPADLLTAVFFDYDGGPLSLTTVSATLAGGSSVFFGADGGGNVGGEWAYAGGLFGAPNGSAYGISSAGFGLFGNANFNGPNLGGPTGVNGMEYGITSMSDDTTTGNSAVTGGFQLIKHSVVFVLTGLALDFDLDNIYNVSFQYGTNLEDEPNIIVPAPGALALLAMGGMVASRRRRR